MGRLGSPAESRQPAFSNSQPWALIHKGSKQWFLSSVFFPYYLLTLQIKENTFSCNIWKWWSCCNLRSLPMHDQPYRRDSELVLRGSAARCCAGGDCAQTSVSLAPPTWHRDLRQNTLGESPPFGASTNIYQFCLLTYQTFFSQVNFKPSFEQYSLILNFM